MVPQSEVIPDPRVLHESPAALHGLDDEIRAEPARLEPTCRIQLPELVEGRGCEQVKSCQVEEGPRRHRFVRPLLPMREAVDIRPVLFEARLLGGARYEPHVPTQGLRENPVDVRRIGLDDRTVRACDPYRRQRNIRVRGRDPLAARAPCPPTRSALRPSST